MEHKFPLFGIFRPEKQGCFPFNQNFRKFGNSSKWNRNFPEKFPEIPETVEFPKSEAKSEAFKILEIPAGSKVE